MSSQNVERFKPCVAWNAKDLKNGASSAHLSAFAGDDGTVDLIFSACVYESHLHVACLMLIFS